MCCYDTDISFDDFKFNLFVVQCFHSFCGQLEQNLSCTLTWLLSTTLFPPSALFSWKAFNVLPAQGFSQSPWVTRVCVCIKRISSNTESTESFFLCLPFSLFTSLHCTSIFVNLTILISLYEPSRGLRQLATQHTALFSTATLLKIKQEQYQSKSNSHI